MASNLHIRGHNAQAAQAGYTLMELAIALFISSLMILGVLSCYSYLTRGILRAGFAGQMESASRRTLTTFDKDVSAATGISSATASAFTLTTSSGPSVTYTYSSSAGTLVRTAGTVSTQMLSGLGSLSFAYYNSPTSTTSSTYAMKLVSINFKTTAGSQTSGNRANLPLQSAMVVLRNKAYLQ